MTLSNLTIEHLEIPFKMAFSHASATRVITDSVLVSVSSNGNTGYGESCPRSYVTNETYESASAFFDKHRASLLESVSSLHSLKMWADSNCSDIDLNPAAWCAIELAILDLLAKDQNCSIEKLLQLPELSGDFSYTAVLGDSSMKSFTKLLRQYHSMGFTDYKLKLSGELEHDKAKCDLVFNTIKNVRVRLDANNLWDKAEDVIKYIETLGHKYFAIEEPLRVGDYDGMSLIANKLGLRIILDESFLRAEQFELLKDNPSSWIVNIRISKMGGLLRSINITEISKAVDIECILGAQVGETSILTRSALTLANSNRDVIIAQEGGCGTYLLEQDICEPVLMFGKGGLISTKQTNSILNSGFGLKINK